MDHDDAMRMLKAMTTAFNEHDLDGIGVRGCDLWTLRDGTVVKKDSYWKIRTAG